MGRVFTMSQGDLKKDSEADFYRQFKLRYSVAHITNESMQLFDECVPLQR